MLVALKWSKIIKMISVDGLLSVASNVGSRYLWLIHLYHHCVSLANKINNKTRKMVLQRKIGDYRALD